MQIYILRDNQQTGPFTEAEVRAQLAAGTITFETMAWWDGLPEWQPLAQTPLGTAPATAPLPPGLAAAPALAADGTTIVKVQRTSGLAIGSLISGILGLGCWPILGPAAVVMGHISRSQIKKQYPALTGGGLALAGLILGYIEICLFIAYMVLLVVMGPQIQAQVLKMQQQLQNETQKQPDQNQDTNNTPPAAPENQPATPPPAAPDQPASPPANPPPATPPSQ